MKKIGKQLLSICLVATLLVIAGCDKKQSTTKINDNQGRGEQRAEALVGEQTVEQVEEISGYIQQDIEYPCKNYWNIEQREDGTLVCYGVSEEDKFTVYKLNDKGEWEVEKTPSIIWPEDMDHTFKVYEIKNILYLLYATRDGNLSIALFKDNGTSESIPLMHNNQKVVAADSPYFTRVDNEGNLFIQEIWPGPVSYYDIKTGHLIRTYGEGATDFEVGVSEIYTMEGCVLKAYDKQTAMEKSSVVYESGSRGRGFRITLDKTKEAIYIINEGGIVYHRLDGELWEKVVEPSGTAIGSGTLQAIKLYILKDGSFIVQFGGSDSFNIKRYYYSENVSTKKNQINILMVTENPQVRQAAYIYETTYKDVAVNIQVSSSDTSLSYSEMLQSLNTELLAGMGPDLMVLDNLPCETYIKQGILAPLNDVVEGPIKKGEVGGKYIGTFKRDDIYYAVPTNYYVPLIWGDEEIVGKIHTIEELAAYKKSHPNEVLMNKTMPELFAQFIRSCEPNWFDENGKLDKVKMRAFFDSITTLTEKEYSKVDTSEYCYSLNMMSNSNAKIKELLDVGYGDTKLFAFAPYGPYQVMIAASALGQRGNGTVGNMIAQGVKPYVCTSILGINANSKNIEAAKEIIRIALSEEVQKNGSAYGMPINKNVSDVLNKEMTDYKEDLTDDTGRRITYNYNYDALYKQAMECYEEADFCTSTYSNNQIFTFIYEEGMAYCTGEKALDEVIENIERQLELQLVE